MKKLIVLTSVLLLSTSSPISNASNIACPTNQSYDTYSNTVQPYAEVIITKYRNYHGKLQYRRWNQTLGEWVDSSWIDIG